MKAMPKSMQSAITDLICDWLSCLYRQLRSRMPRKIKTYAPLRKMNALLVRMLKREYAEIHGQKMFVGSDSMALSVLRFYEPYSTEIVTREVKEGQVVLDLGANIGYYTLLFAQLVGGQGKVFAFEPIPELFAMLNRNVELNSHRNVTTVRKAVSDRTMKGKIYVSSHRENHNLFDSTDNVGTVEVDMVSLDDYFAGWAGGIDFVKMDVEGAEALALAGMKNLVRRNRKLKILTEFRPRGLKMSGVPPQEFLEMLSTSGFLLYQIDQWKRNSKLVRIPDLLKEAERDDLYITNLLCLPRGDESWSAGVPSGDADSFF